MNTATGSVIALTGVGRGELHAYFICASCKRFVASA
jgi:hypothetical protein